MTKIYTQDQFDYIIQHYPKEGDDHCVAHTGLPKWKVRQLAYSKGLKLDPTMMTARRREYTRRLHSAKREIAGLHVDIRKLDKIDDPRVAYMLGLLWADGSLSSSSVVLECVDEDIKDVCETFNVIGIWSYSRRQRTHDGKPFGRPQGCLRITDYALAAKLKEWDYPFKSSVSPIRVLTDIPPDLRSYFWRGFLDGDGCIYVPACNSKTWGASVAFWSTLGQDWVSLNEMLESLGMKGRYQRHERHKTNGQIHRSSCVTVSRKRDVLKLLGYIYQGESRLGLARKKLKYDQIKQDVEAKTAGRSKQGSMYRGVRRSNAKSGWYAMIKKDKKATYLGTFETEIAAAHAYNEAAKRLFGMRAILNDLT